MSSDNIHQRQSMEPGFINNKIFYKPHIVAYMHTVINVGNEFITIPLTLSY